MRLLGFPHSPGLLAAALLSAALTAAAQDRRDPPQGKEEPPAIEVLSVKHTPQGARVGDEMTIIAEVRNSSPRLTLVNLRLHLTSELTLLAPDAEQTVFIEAKATREVKWRVRITAAGDWRASVEKDVICEGRPVQGPKPDLPAQARAALARTWRGTWESPAGFVYEAEVRLRLDDSGAVEGRIDWTLKKAPPDRKDYQGKAGQKGVEYVWGVYDPKARSLEMEGYRRDDPREILGLDRYRLTLSEDFGDIEGFTWNHGTWKAAFKLAPK